MPALIAQRLRARRRPGVPAGAQSEPRAPARWVPEARLDPSAHADGTDFSGRARAGRSHRLNVTGSARPRRGQQISWPTLSAKSLEAHPCLRRARQDPLSPPPAVCSPGLLFANLSRSTVLANWNSVRAGGGSNPANFTTAGQTFVIQNGNNMPAGSVWSVSGIGNNITD